VRVFHSQQDERACEDRANKLHDPPAAKSTDCRRRLQADVQMTTNRAKTLEKKIHKIFEKQRRYGEWFDVSIESIDKFIRVLRSVY